MGRNFCSIFYTVNSAIVSPSERVRILQFNSLNAKPGNPFKVVLFMLPHMFLLFKQHLPGFQQFFAHHAFVDSSSYFIWNALLIVLIIFIHVSSLYDLFELIIFNT